MPPAFRGGKNRSVAVHVTSSPVTDSPISSSILAHPPKIYGSDLDKLDHPGPTGGRARRDHREAQRVVERVETTAEHTGWSSPSRPPRSTPGGRARRDHR